MERSTLDQSPFIKVDVSQMDDSPKQDLCSERKILQTARVGSLELVVGSGEIGERKNIVSNFGTMTMLDFEENLEKEVKQE